MMINSQGERIQQRKQLDPESLINSQIPDSESFSNVNSLKEEGTNKYFFEATADSSETLTKNIILTGISLTGACNSNAQGTSITILAKINGVTTTGIVVRASAQGQGNSSIFVPIPNWFLPIGTVLSFDFTINVADGVASFIGFTV